MDAKSAKTSFSSSRTWTVDEDQWYGQLPCVCCNSRRGCHRHNPTQSLIYHDPRMPPKKQRANYFTRVISLFWYHFCDALFPKELSQILLEPLLLDVALAKDPELQPEPESEPKPHSIFRSELPFDSQSVDTITPIHSSMPYHIAIYHLDCIRRQLDPNVQIAFIPELSCAGSSIFYYNGPEYTWSSEIYFHKGTFLQKQELSYTLDRSSSCRTLDFTQCPHSGFTITSPSFKDDDGLLIAKTLLRFRPIPQQEISGSKWWTSKMGRYARMYCCSACHSDAETTLELLGRELHIRHTYYRDLGSATDRSIPKWICLLTGEGLSNPYRLHCDLSARVWQIAKKLKRPNLHLVTYATTSGEVSLETIPYVHGT